MAATWQYRNDDGKFVNFTKKDSSALEKAWSMDLATPLPLLIRGHPYTIDLAHHTQTNDVTKTQRLIRRLDTASGATPFDPSKKVPQWEWESGKGVFTAYDQETNAKIEDAFHKEALHVTVTLAVTAHATEQFMVHFGHMHQERLVEGKGSGVSRKIRRVLRVPVAATAAAAADDTSDLTSRKAVMEAKLTAATAVVSTTSKKRALEEDKVVTSPATDSGSKDLPVSSPTSAVSLASLRLPTVADWTIHASSVLVLPPRGTVPTAPFRIAGFDMDDTLVFPHGGAVFAKSRSDWQWLCSAVVPVLQELHHAGYLVTIFSNQSGIGGKGWDESKANDIRGKIVDLSVAAGIPIAAFIATKEDEFRKPSTAMWELCTSMMPVEVASSFYCGDAAGRTIMTMAGRKKDFSCSDRKFAYNVGIRFLTPEQIYTHRHESPRPWLRPSGAFAEAFGWDGLGPSELAAVATSYPKGAVYHKPAGSLELVLFVGFPGCGKSTFAKRFFLPFGYTIVNRDTLKTPAKCLQTAEASLSSKKSVVIDNTNPSAEARAPYIAMAKKYGAAVRSFHFGHDAKLANHMNCMRARLGISARVSSIAYNMFKSQFEAPKGSEGIDEAVEIPPTADFTDLPPQTQKIFFQLS